MEIMKSLLRAFVFILSMTQTISIGMPNSFIPQPNRSLHKSYRDFVYKQNERNKATHGLINPPNQYRHAYKPSSSRAWNSNPNNVANERRTFAQAWSEWTTWSKCSKSCNGGVKSRTRICQRIEEPSASVETNSIIPSCAGYDKDYQACNRKQCLTPKEYQERKYEVKKKQCRSFNTKPYMGQLYEWIPYIRGQFAECTLNCLADGHRMFKSFGHVQDGTPCGKDGRTACKNGRCIISKVNRKGVIATKASPNVGVRSPKNIRSKRTEFALVQRRFTNDKSMKLGYNAMFSIPRGAVNVSIEEKTSSKNYLVLKVGERFVLNGRWQVERNPKVLFAAGSKISYKLENNKERIVAVGPLSTSLRVLVLYQKDKVDVAFNYSISLELLLLNGSIFKPLSRQYNHFPPNNQFKNQLRNQYNAAPFQPYRNQQHQEKHAQFQYVISRVDPGREGGGIDNSNQENAFKWQIGGITRCSKPCGGGEQEYVYRCFHVNGLRTGKFVEDSLCRKVTKPYPKRRICNPKPCPTRWVISDWAACSKTCGYNSIQRRSVLCRKTQYINHTLVQNTVNDVACRKEEKPVGYRECDYIPCYYKWEAGDWNECSASCDYGFQKRRVFCEHTRGFQIPDENCELEKKPNVTRRCLVIPCSTTWFTSEWSPCNSSCHHAYQTRQVICATSTGATVSASFCNIRTKPTNIQECTGTICQNAFWVTTDWSKCSRPCGVGKQFRKVICMHQHHGRFKVKPDRTCKKQKPADEKFCRIVACSPLWYTNVWTQCSKTCGAGERRRNLICLTEDGAPARGCMYDSRPLTRSPCNRGNCPIHHMTTAIVDERSRYRQRVSDMKSEHKQTEVDDVSTTTTTTTKNKETRVTNTKSSNVKQALTLMKTTVKRAVGILTSDSLEATTNNVNPTKSMLTTIKKRVEVTTKNVKTKARTNKVRKAFQTTTKTSIVPSQQRQTSQKTHVKKAGQIFNPLRPFAYLSSINACFDIQSPAYCHVISVRLKFCKILRFKRLCCKSCKK